MSWSFLRNMSLGAKVETASQKHIIHLSEESKEDLISLLNGTNHNPVVIEKLFPRYIQARSGSEANPIVKLHKDGKFESLELKLNRTTNGLNDTQQWWIVNQTQPGKIKLTKDHKAGLELYVFSDQVSPPSLGFLAGYGIMGLYASVVLVIGKFVREFFSGIHHTIMFEELPFVDRILKLCTDIFLVRETGELDLEEDMYAKLIFLYRSPETMIKWTRDKNQ
ncbi:hypothetical protein AAFF_G00292780 [Aldrovandia affinis]|uniref:Piezo non-specific cation channel cap domain-containing protein n=1 Tax=Aldrovandia affinis TaxID=143900 RepID=A0AAD7SRS3_9TELE|nr:hypothetical protein AAFF_G00292780 [Aldrovandia affinis]